MLASNHLTSLLNFAPISKNKYTLNSYGKTYIHWKMYVSINRFVLVISRYFAVAFAYWSFYIQVQIISFYSVFRTKSLLLYLWMAFFLSPHLQMQTNKFHIIIIKTFYGSQSFLYFKPALLILVTVFKQWFSFCSIKIRIYYCLYFLFIYSLFFFILQIK